MEGGEPDFGEGEDRVVGRDDDIAQQGDLGAAAERRPLDRRDGEWLEIEQESRVFAYFRQHRIRPGGDVVCNVDAGREGARQGAFQEQHADLRNVTFAQRVVELSQRFDVQDVQGWPVERDVGDPIEDPNRDRNRRPLGCRHRR